MRHRLQILEKGDRELYAQRVNLLSWLEETEKELELATDEVVRGQLEDQRGRLRTRLDTLSRRRGKYDPEEIERIRKEIDDGQKSIAIAEKTLEKLKGTSGKAG